MVADSVIDPRASTSLLDSPDAGSPAVSPSSANCDSSFGFTASAVAPSARLTVISAVLAPVPATAAPRCAVGPWPRRCGGTVRCT